MRERLNRLYRPHKITHMQTSIEPNETKTGITVKVGYARVSSRDQNLDRQLSQLEAAGCSKIFAEKLSGASSDRPELHAALEYLRPGETLVVASMDRLARNTVDLLNLVRDATERGAYVEFLSEHLTFGPEEEAIPSLMLGILGSIAQFERTLIRERQAQGIAKAKERGVYRGRSKSLGEEEVQTLRELASLGVSKSEIGRRLGVSRATVYRYLDSSA